MFRLQRVLEERKRREEALQGRYAAATRARVQAEGLLTMLRTAAAVRREDLAGLLAGGRVDATRVLALGQALDEAARAARTQEAEVRRRATFEEEERARLTAAMADHKALERLREQHEQRERRELLRREALTLDELATARAARQRTVAAR